MSLVRLAMNLNLGRFSDNYWIWGLTGFIFIFIIPKFAFFGLMILMAGAVYVSIRKRELKGKASKKRILSKEDNFLRYYYLYMLGFSIISLIYSWVVYVYGTSIMASPAIGLLGLLALVLSIVAIVKFKKNKFDKITFICIILI